MVLLDVQDFFLLSHLFEHFLVVTCPLADGQLSYFEFVICEHFVVTSDIAPLAVCIKFYRPLEPFIPRDHRNRLETFHH